ncbi:Alpha/Beta hydrolase protein [Sparassis latifolia]
MLVSPLYAVVLAILLPFAAVAAPASGRRGETIPTLAASQIQSYTTYTWYANAAYCAPSKTLAWECGLSCNANPAFQPIAAGGDGSDVQFWFVGYDPALDTVIVSHQGTNPQAILPLLTDADIVLEQLDASLFPGVSSSVRVHSGFAREHSKTATAVLAAVQEAMSTYSVGRVTIVGHSLGELNVHYLIPPSDALSQAQRSRF